MSSEPSPVVADPWACVRRPVFIVGAPRSGTTLLRSLLCAHPRLAISPETHYMRIAETFGAGEAAAPADFELFWKALREHLQLRATGVDLEHARTLVAAADRRDFRAIFASLLAAQAAQAGKRRAGEKTPGHEHHLQRLFDWFPKAQAIFVQRDPRACAASALPTPWVREQMCSPRLSAPFCRRTRAWHLAFKAQEWLDSYRIAWAWRRDPRVLTISYERLIEASERVLREVCVFLGEDWSAAMLATRTPSLVDADKPGMRWRDWTLEHERRAAAPIGWDSLERWRGELTPAEAAMIEGVCAPGMAALGYEFSRSERARRRGRRRASAILSAERAESAFRSTLKRALGRTGEQPMPALAAATADVATRLAAQGGFA